MVGFSINKRGITKMTRAMQREFDKHPIRVPVEVDDATVLRAVSGSTIHNYSGPVFHGDVTGAQLAWNNQNVIQNQQKAADIAPGFEQLAQVVVAFLQQLSDVGLNDQDREDAEAAAKEILAEVTQPEPKLGKVRRALAALKGFLAPIATGITAGVAAGSQEWARSAISDLGVPFG